MSRLSKAADALRGVAAIYAGIVALEKLAQQYGGIEGLAKRHAELEAKCSAMTRALEGNPSGQAKQWVQEQKSRRRR